MKYIKISDLKKEAKQLRKNNKEIKNHSESLNIIANKYNKEKWEDLLDSSVLLLKEDRKLSNLNKSKKDSNKNPFYF